MFEDDDTFDDDDIRAEGEEFPDEILELAKKEFERIVNDEADQDNKRVLVEDQRFILLGEQWPQEVKDSRLKAGKPCPTVNVLGASLRQVVNDARQNKPSIRVSPVDDNADPQTADILSDLIRNIEYISNAQAAYDTGSEQAASGGHGYWKVVADYARHDSFELDALVKRIINPCNIYPDPDSTAVDSSDWNTCFEVERYTTERYEREFNNAAKIDWEAGSYGTLKDPWKTDDGVLVASWWRRREVEKPGYVMSDGTFMAEEDLADPDTQMALEAEGVTPVRPHVYKSYKVTQYVMSGAELLKTIPWPGQYIPIIPVYGHEYIIEGRRYFRGVMHAAKDAQKLLNFWRATSAELVSLAPKQPWLVPEGAIDADNEEIWATANTVNHAYLPYKGGKAPTRLPMDMGTPAGAINESLTARDDIKAISGIYDASLGARSNETSGVAIRQRQQEGDVGTFNFQDNVSRAIRHTGIVLLDIIPKIYTKDRIIRIVGEDGTPETKRLGEPMPVVDEESGEQEMEPAIDPMTGQPQMIPAFDPNTLQPVIDPATEEQVMQPVMVPVTRILDLGVGKYDVVVQAGPSYTTRRQEAAAAMTELMQAAPDMWGHVADIYVKAQDWPMADEFAERLKERLQLGEPPPEVQQMQQQLEELNGQMEQAGAEMQALQAENEQLKQKAAVEAQQLQAKTAVEMGKLAIEHEKMALQREEMQLEALKLQIEQQKIAADVEKARIAAEASRPMVVQPAPAQPMPMHRMPDGGMMPGATHGEQPIPRNWLADQAVGQQVAPTPY